MEEEAVEDASDAVGTCESGAAAAEANGGGGPPHAKGVHERTKISRQWGHLLPSEMVGHMPHRASIASEMVGTPASEMVGTPSKTVRPRVGSAALLGVGRPARYINII